MATHFVGDIAHLVGPAQLHGNFREDHGQGGAQIRAAIGDNESHTSPLYTAKEQTLQKLQPGGFAVALGEMAGHDLALAVKPHTIGHQHPAALHLRGEIEHFQNDGMQEQIHIVAPQRALVGLRYGVVELASDVGDRLRGIAFSYWAQALADLAGQNAAKKSFQDEFVHSLLAALINAAAIAKGSRGPWAEPLGGRASLAWW